MEATAHIPVMKHEAIEALKLEIGMTVVDATLGGGGYTRAISEAIGAKGRVIALDADHDAIRRFEDAYQSQYSNVELVHSNYGYIGSVLEGYEIDQVDAIVADLGLSSDQLADKAIGFSFDSTTLDMRMDRSADTLNAQDYLTSVDQGDLAKTIYRYGDEKYAQRIARAIVSYRDVNGPITSAKTLAQCISAEIGHLSKSGGIHPATKTFQAIRIVVNEEFRYLEDFIASSISALRPGGYISIVSFHSGEDRIVKNLLREYAKDCVCEQNAPLCTCDHVAAVEVMRPAPLKPTDQEIVLNPRARSAKLRIARRV
jgi:16S rRNA (cytosine1402-N4)-methyltransferase